MFSDLTIYHDDNHRFYRLRLGKAILNFLNLCETITILCTRYYKEQVFLIKVRVQYNFGGYTNPFSIREVACPRYPREKHALCKPQ